MILRRRLETGDWRLETGDWRRETGNGRWKMGDGRMDTGTDGFFGLKPIVFSLKSSLKAEVLNIVTQERGF